MEKYLEETKYIWLYLYLVLKCFFGNVIRFVIKYIFDEVFLYLYFDTYLHVFFIFLVPRESIACDNPDSLQKEYSQHPSIPFLIIFLRV